LTAIFFGAFVGFAIGCIVEGVADLMLGLSTRQIHIVKPVKNEDLFDRDLPRMMPED
jgi:hypothetical protein